MPSPFLDLPAELRNRIFILALTAPDNVVAVTWQRGVTKARKKPVMVALDGNDAHPINQVKYVNRQLYNETAGLEIQHNAIAFQSQLFTQAGATIGLFNFVRRCTPNKLQWLKRVILRENTDLDKPKAQRDALVWMKDHMRMIIKLLDFCACNPHITIELNVPGFCIINNEDDYVSFTFLTVGIFITWAFRSEDIIDIASELGPDTRRTYRYMYSDILGKHRRDVESRRHRAGNLWFCMQRKGWELDKFRGTALATWSRVSIVPVPDAEGVETWVRYARQWTANGV